METGELEVMLTVTWLRLASEIPFSLLLFILFSLVACKVVCYLWAVATCVRGRGSKFPSGQ